MPPCNWKRDGAKWRVKGTVPTLCSGPTQMGHGASLAWLKVAEPGLELRSTAQIRWSSTDFHSRPALVGVESVQGVVDMPCPAVPGTPELLHKHLFLLLFLMGGSWHLAV